MAMSMPQPLHAVETFEMLASGSFGLLPGFRTFVRCVCVCVPGGFRVLSKFL